MTAAVAETKVRYFFAYGFFFGVYDPRHLEGYHCRAIRQKASGDSSSYSKLFGNESIDLFAAICREPHLPEKPKGVEALRYRGVEFSVLKNSFGDPGKRRSSGVVLRRRLVWTALKPVVTNDVHRTRFCGQSVRRRRTGHCRQLRLMNEFSDPRAGACFTPLFESDASGQKRTAPENQPSPWRKPRAQELRQRSGHSSRSRRDY